MDESPGKGLERGGRGLGIGKIAEMKLKPPSTVYMYIIRVCVYHTLPPPSSFHHHRHPPPLNLLFLLILVYRIYRWKDRIFREG